MQTRRNKFPKAQRLCSHKLIEHLFAGGNRSMSAFPLRMIYRHGTTAADHTPGVQVLISVSKRHFHHAIDRNRVKRQLREAWRLNRDLLMATLPPEAWINVVFIWQADQHQPTDTVARKMRNLLHRLSEELCAG